jgi:hypothetical protein
MFPGARPVEVPVQLTSVASAEDAPEMVVVEYATQREVLFACTSPLEFADRIRLRNSDGSLDEAASVVAVQCHEGQIAVAARFARRVADWIVKL